MADFVADDLIAAWNRRAGKDINVATNLRRRNIVRLIDEIAYQEKIAKIPIEERTFVKAWETAQDMPTIDAMHVVRCRECQRWHREVAFKDACACAFWSGGKGRVRYTKPDDYCSCGAKMEDKP